MPDQEVIHAVRALLRGVAGVREAERDEADGAIAAVAGRHVRDHERVWWWQSVAHDSMVVLDYADGDGLTLLAAVLPDDVHEVATALTDDDEPPWPVLIGNPSALLTLLRELHFVEFWIAPRDGEWVVFDTHHNTLVVCGSAVERRALALGGNTVSTAID